MTLGSRGARNDFSRKEAPSPTGRELGPWKESSPPVEERSNDPTEPGEQPIVESPRLMLTAPNERGSDRPASSRWLLAMPRLSI